MLLGLKKNHHKEQNWCLILNPIYNEIDKRKVAHKISEMFSLSPEEAEELVDNTPIILLDNLPRAVADRVKKHFQPTGAEVFMTNEVYLKRKCYRTVWPEPPNLSFFLDNHESKVHGDTEDSQRLNPDEALDEIRVTTQNPRESHERAQSLERKDVSRDEGHFVEELALLKKERDNWRDKFNEQRRTSEKLGWEISMREGEDKPHDAERDSGQFKAIENQQALLNHAKERFEGLQEEYRQARSLFEEKLTALQQENTEWKNKAEVINHQLQSSGLERSALEMRLQEQEKRVGRWKEKNQLLEEELGILKLKQGEKTNLVKEAETRQAALEADSQSLSAALKEEQGKCQNLERKYMEFQINASEKIESLTQELETMQEKVKTLEKNQLRLIRELDGRTDEVRQWEVKARDLEDPLKELKNSHENLEKMLEINMKHLESREKELETVRRQLRDLQANREQQAMIEKKVHLSTQLAEKESALKRLVAEQEKVESEIREREERISRILAEQESFEKEIMEGKQASRHYLEQIKKEKAPRLKTADGSAAARQTFSESTLSQDR